MSKRTARADFSGLVVATFLRHWRDVLQRLLAGEDVAAQRSKFVLAGSTPAEQRIARRLYDIGHARHLAAMDRTNVARCLEPWTDAAFEFATGDVTMRDEPYAAFVESLVRAEYVVMVDRCGDLDEEAVPMVCPLPDERVTYGDLYELSAASSTGGVIRICKSTGTPFTASERRSAQAGIRRDFYANAAADGEPRSAWTLLFHDEDDARFLVVQAVAS